MSTRQIDIAQEAKRFVTLAASKKSFKWLRLVFIAFKVKMKCPQKEWLVFKYLVDYQVKK